MLLADEDTSTLAIGTEQPRPAGIAGYGPAESDWQFSCRILLFDEATSALDSSTENSILDTLQRLGQGRTTLFVAHRLSTAARCDQVRMQASQRSATCRHLFFYNLS